MHCARAVPGKNLLKEFPKSFALKPKVTEKTVAEKLRFTAVSRKVVGKSARDNPERYCGWFCLPCSPKKIERMAREATDICSRVLMESNKNRFDSYSR